MRGGTAAGSDEQGDSEQPRGRDLEQPRIVTWTTAHSSRGQRMLCCCSAAECAQVSALEPPISVLSLFSGVGEARGEVSSL